MKKSRIFCAMSALLFSLTGTLIGQTSDTSRYWIKENFSTFTIENGWNTSPVVYETSPNQVSLNAYYANIEEVEGTCGIDTNVSKNHLRIRGLKDGGWASFTVPNADTVVVNLRGKSHNRDRIIRVFRNDELVETFTKMDEDTCVVFKDVILSSEPVTYKITGGDSASDKPVIIYGIEVTKFSSSGIHTGFLTDNRIHVYPNPVKDFLTITNDDGLIIKSMEIYNLSGQLISSHKGNILKINTNHLPEGAYFLKVNTDSRSLFSKFIKL